ncbi:hypothetical protein G7046_g277 [Stylonectria norvegica]|nr:hypothetical protein G7046_g277 [Stylonectria norvegica]
MKSMKGLSMNKVLGSIKKKASGSGSPGSSSNGTSGTTPAATPEATAHNSVTDEVLFLPPIVDAAESSPAAAAECARLIRKYLSKDYSTKPSWQYNAIMLVRILTDNPGPTFTRNMDQKFVDTIKQLLKNARDPSVRQILMETLDDFENNKAGDENLALIISMWQKEKEKAFKEHGGSVPPPRAPPAQFGSPTFNPHSQNYFARSHNNKRIPDPIELASRLEEARTSAKLLEQVVMNTPPTEMLDNDLIKEFADRCSSASRSIQGYMTSENPTPDNDTMENLIDTNEQLQTALNQHKRAVLHARKQLGLHEVTPTTSPAPGPERNGERPSQPQEQQRRQGSGASSSDSVGPPLPDGKPSRSKGKGTEAYDPPPGPPPGLGLSGVSGLDSGSGSNKLLPEEPHEEPYEDPFKDPHPAASSSRPGPGTTGDYLDQRLSFEPFHPGFQATDSYTGRQNSAIGKTAMHGAGTAPSPTTEEPGHPLRQRVDDVSDDDDIYEATPKAKEPMYRQAHASSVVRFATETYDSGRPGGVLRRTLIDGLGPVVLGSLFGGGSAKPSSVAPFSVPSIEASFLAIQSTRLRTHFQFNSNFNVNCNFFIACKKKPAMSHAETQKQTQSSKPGNLFYNKGSPATKSQGPQSLAPAAALRS